MLCREPMRALDFHDVLADTDDATWFDLHVISHLSSACDLWLEKGVSLTRHDKKLPYYDPWLIYQTCGCRHRQNIWDNYIIMCIYQMFVSATPRNRCIQEKQLLGVNACDRSEDQDRRNGAGNPRKLITTPGLTICCNLWGLGTQKTTFSRCLIFELLELCILFWTEHGEGSSDILSYWKSCSEQSA